MVDDGLEIAHEDLASNMVANDQSINYVTGSNDPTNDATDTSSGHGTAVAGIVAARDLNSVGVRGVAPRAKLAGYNLLQNSTSPNEVDAMTRNAVEVSMSSNSWGATDGTGELEASSTFRKSAIDTGLATNVMAAARPVTASRVVPQLSQSLVWFDGDREQQVWLNPQLVAEFSPSKRGATAARGVDAKAKMLPMNRNQSGVRLWQIDNTGDMAVRSLKSGNPAGKYSPVFHNSPSSMRALPGNIIIYLDPAWDAAAEKAWLQKRNMEVVKKLWIGLNIYVMKTGPGLEALETANILYKSGEVKAAFPDWWQEVQAK